MGALLQRLLLRVLPEQKGTDGPERQHVTAALGCCSTILIDENSMHHDKEDTTSEEDDSSDLDR